MQPALDDDQSESLVDIKTLVVVSPSTQGIDVHAVALKTVDDFRDRLSICRLLDTKRDKMQVVSVRRIKLKCAMDRDARTASPTKGLYFYCIQMREVVTVPVGSAPESVSGSSPLGNEISEDVKFAEESNQSATAQ